MLKRITFIAGLLFSFYFLQAQSQQFHPDLSVEINAGDFEVSEPLAVVSSVEAEWTFKYIGEDDRIGKSEFPVKISINGIEENVEWVNKSFAILEVFDSSKDFEVTIGEYKYSRKVNPVPLWLSILPPLLTIALALIFREVLSSLFAGIFLGSVIIGIYNEGSLGLITGFFDVIDTHIKAAVFDSDHLAIIVFTMIIGGVVALVSKNGGMQGIVNRISKFASNARNGQLSTWFLGVIIFFDDYANTLVVGNTMRPVTDKLRISREKLSYIVDSTAAPIAAIAFVTTWIGAELGYIDDGIKKISESGYEFGIGSYSVFLNSLQYSFYPILTLVFILFLIWQNKDFGPMWKAERRARVEGKLVRQESSEHLNNEEMSAYQPVEGMPIRAYNAVIPILIIIIGTMAGLFITGYSHETWNNPELGFGRKLSVIVGDSDSYTALLWSSLLSLIVAILMTAGTRRMTLPDTMSAVVNGFKFMMHAILILVLAWSLAQITDHMQTAEYLQGVLGDDASPWYIPALVFLLAAAVSFSTGSSWGAMAILYPLVLPLAWKVSMDAGYSNPDAMMIFYNVVSCVLAGSVLGDHCSPISDTTILSSLATSCDHIDHVKTQMPYALTVGGISLLIGTIPGALGVSSWILFPLAMIVLWAIVKWAGKEVPSGG